MDSPYKVSMASLGRQPDAAVEEIGPEEPSGTIPEPRQRPIAGATSPGSAWATSPCHTTFSW